MFKTPDSSSNNEKKYQKPFIELYIDELTISGKYVIVGTVVFIGEDHIVVNDGTGEAVVTPSTDFDLGSIKEGAQIRVFGYVEITPEKSVNARIIHNLSEVDIELYQRVRELEKSVFTEAKNQ